MAKYTLGSFGQNNQASGTATTKTTPSAHVIDPPGDSQPQAQPTGQIYMKGDGTTWIRYADGTEEKIKDADPNRRIATWDQSTQDLISKQISEMDKQSDDIWTRLFGGGGKTGISGWTQPSGWGVFSKDVGDVETSMGDIAEKVSTVAGQAGNIRQDLTMAQGSFGGP